DDTSEPTRAPRAGRLLPPRGGAGEALQGRREGGLARAATGGQGEILRQLGLEHYLLQRRHS
ncbi:hypothetical protein ACJX0J_041972, partial [Zea mays]